MWDWYAQEGSPSPLGVTWIENEGSYNFALYSRYATAVTLLLFSELDVSIPTYEIRLDPLANKSGYVWHFRATKNSIPLARYYGYQVAGPNTFEQGHRFDPRKVLLDPYARCVCFPTRFSREAASKPGSNAGRSPLGMIATETYHEWDGERAPKHTSDLVIYELHVRGFTRRVNSGVSATLRGAFLGVIEKIPYLTELGITAVELMPIMQQDPQEGSYWGYMPLNFFSPNHEYASADKPFGALNEFRVMVKALHAAGIEVLLDVVYNHTSEGSETGPSYSFRGIDNATYYLLGEDRTRYRNDTGTGNTLNCGNPCVRKMILDSMRFWQREMRVDGFRFDLASIFTRNQDGSINLKDPPVIAEIGGEPGLESLRLIAEAWDSTTYQLGQSFPGTTWLQWNGQYRDNLRAFVRGDPGMVSKLMSGLYGSSDLFPDGPANSYHPYQSVNFITCHDGFCLYDLVSYNEKHNDANGEASADGASQNFSWNSGWEGDEGVPPDVMLLRKQQVKNFCALLFLSNGTPMFCAGDEFMNTQKGNNNPYNQDDDVTWLDWDLLTRNQDVFRFFKQMIAFRKAHPSISRSRFWRDDVRWYGPTGQSDMSRDSHSLAFFLRGAAQEDKDIYVMINAYWEPVAFHIKHGQTHEWLRVIDTSLPSPDDFCESGAEESLQSSEYIVRARSIVVMLRH